MKRDAEFVDGWMNVSCAVTGKDIEMMLDRFDSGMADLTTSNAVAIALKRVLGRDAYVRVIGDGTGRQFFCLYEGGKAPLPAEVCDWLAGCFRGVPAEPIEFEICLPFENAEDGEAEMTSDDQHASIAA